MPAPVTRDIQADRYQGAERIAHAYPGTAGDPAALSAAAPSAVALAGVPESGIGPRNPASRPTVSLITDRHNAGTARKNRRSPLKGMGIAKISSVVAVVVVAVTLAAIYAAGHFINHDPALGADPATSAPVRSPSVHASSAPHARQFKCGGLRSARKPVRSAVKPQRRFRQPDGQRVGQSVSHFHPGCDGLVTVWSRGSAPSLRTIPPGK